MDQARESYSGQKSVFYEKLQQCEIVRIGRKSFVNKSDYFRHILRIPVADTKRLWKDTKRLKMDIIGNRPE